MDLAAIEPLDFRRHAQDLRETWQARVLVRALKEDGAPVDAVGGVILSVLAHSYDEAMPVLLRVMFPGFTSIRLPFLCSAGKIAKTGQVCADMVTCDGQIVKMQAFFRDPKHMERAFRRLADAMKFTDEERLCLFAAVRRWVVCDFRIDPNMDPRDPAAKRLVH